MALSRSEIKNKSPEELAKYIIDDRSEQRLPTDKLYVSFSLDQFISDYEVPPHIFLGDDEKKKAEQLNIQTIQLIKITLMREWLAKTKIKFSFAARKSNKISAQNDYVIYFIKCNFDNANKRAATASRNLKSRQTHRIFGRMICLNEQFFQAERDEIKMQTILHEFGHALGLKHPLKFSDDDITPFADLDCQETIMTYPHHCNQIINGLKRRYNIDISKGIPRSVSPEIYIYYQTLFLTSIGSVDIAAANKIAEGLQKKKLVNFTQHAVEQNIDQELEIAGDGFVTDIFDVKISNPISSILAVLNGYIDSVITSIQSHINDSVASCPSYFPKDQPTYWRNQHTKGLFFGAAKNATACQVLPAPSVCYLGK